MSLARPLNDLTDSRSASVFLGIIAVFVVFIILDATKLILAPLCIAIVLSLSLNPLARRLTAKGVPHPLSALIVLLGVIGVLGLCTYGLSEALINVIGSFPSALAAMEAKLQSLIAPIEEVKKATEQVEHLAKNLQGSETLVVSNDSIGSVLASGTFATIASIILTFVFMFYLMAFGRGLVRDVIRTLPGQVGKIRVYRIARRIQKNLSHYLITLTLINVGQGTVVALICLATGIPNPLLIGVLGFLFNYVSVVGPVSTHIAILVAGLMAFDEPTAALVPMFMFTAASMIEGQFVTPNLMASRLTLNPVLTLLNLVFWGWFWAVPGALLAIPILASAKIICDHLPRLQAWGRVLGGFDALQAREIASQTIEVEGVQQRQVSLLVGQSILTFWRRLMPKLGRMGVWLETHTGPQILKLLRWLRTRNERLWQALD